MGRSFSKNPNFFNNNQNGCQVKKYQNNYIKTQVESPKHLDQTTFQALKYLQQTKL